MTGDRPPRRSVRLQWGGSNDPKSKTPTHIDATPEGIRMAELEVRWVRPVMQSADPREQITGEWIDLRRIKDQR